MNNRKNSHIFFATVALMVVALLITACSGLPIPSPIKAPAATQAAVPITGDNPSVTVSDQQFDGTQVVIARVVSPGPGWLAIHTDDNGKHGPAIAFAPVRAGENKNVTVQLDPTKATPLMYAMLHTDAGEVGKYEFPGPDVPVVFNGEMVSPSFKITEKVATGDAATSVSVKDQDVKNGKVVIDEVVSPGPGWISIHTEGADGKPGQDIGFVHVNQGSNKNVSVTIDANQITTMMYAILHKDAGEVGTYEFPGADEIIQVNGQDISRPFHNSTAVAANPDPAQPTATTEAAAVEPTATTEAHQMGGEATATPTIHTDEQAQPTATPQSGNSGAILPVIDVADQTIVNSTVTIPHVFSLGDAWLVVHFQNPDGTMGNMVGAAPVKNGDNENVVVTINPDLATPVLYAMLHFDKGVRGSLEFPGADEPVLVRGEMLTPTFNVSVGADQQTIIDVNKDESTFKHLVDGKGMSLYISLNDGPAQSNCVDDCLINWKPVLAGLKVSPGVGVEQAKLGVILRADGSRQVTYAGAPLYTYVDDKNPGDTNGQGIEGVWFLVSP